ncbi:hypothetical protein EV182_008954, partial [Spiromyces aspiralis]
KNSLASWTHSTRTATIRASRISCCGLPHPARTKQRRRRRRRRTKRRKRRSRRRRCSRPSAVCTHTSSHSSTLWRKRS